MIAQYQIRGIPESETKSKLLLEQRKLNKLNRIYKSAFIYDNSSSRTVESNLNGFRSG